MSDLSLHSKEVMCSEHGLDYRLICDECIKKHSKFNKITTKIIKMNHDKN